MGQGVPGGPDAAARGAREERGVEAKGVQHVADEADGILAEVSRPERVRIAEAAPGPVDEVGAGAGRPAEEHQVGQGRGVGAVQVHHRGAVAGRHHVDEAPRRARDEPSLRTGIAQHPVVHLFHRGGVPLRGSGKRMCGHASTIGPAAGARIVLFSNPRWKTGTVGAPEFTGYCSFTKALEHLGDRWSLLIVRQLGAFGPLGFNELTRALPGRISRSVLTERLGGWRRWAWSREKGPPAIA